MKFYKDVRYNQQMCFYLKRGLKRGTSINILNTKLSALYKESFRNAL